MHSYATSFPLHSFYFVLSYFLGIYSWTRIAMQSIEMSVWSMYANSVLPLFNAKGKKAYLKRKIESTQDDERKGFNKYSSRFFNLIGIDRSDDHFQWFSIIFDNFPLETLTVSVVEYNICAFSIKIPMQSSFNLRCRCYVIFHINLVDSIRMRVGFTFLQCNYMYCMIFRKSTVLNEKKLRDLN